MAQFELLDTLLKESGSEEVYSAEPVTEGEKVEASTDKVVIEADSVLYADLDRLVENAMRASLKNTIMESEFDADIKLSHLSLVESASFSEDQILQFMQENIDPILNLWETVTEDSEDYTIAPMPVIEMADAIVSVKEGMDAEDVEKSLYESIVGTSEDAESKAEGELVQELASIIETYDLDEETFNTHFESAKELVAEGKEDLVPTIQELTSIFTTTLELIESGELPEELSFDYVEEGEVLEEAKAATKAASKAVKNVVTYVRGTGKSPAARTRSKRAMRKKVAAKASELRGKVADSKAGQAVGKATAAVAKKAGEAKAAVKAAPGKVATKAGEMKFDAEMKTKAAMKKYGSKMRRTASIAGKKAGEVKAKAGEKVAAGKEYAKQNVGKTAAAAALGGAAAGTAATLAYKKKKNMKEGNEAGHRVAVAFLEGCTEDADIKMASLEVAKWEARLED